MRSKTSPHHKKSFGRLLSTAVLSSKLSADFGSFLRIIWYGGIKPSLATRGFVRTIPSNHYDVRVESESCTELKLRLCDNQMDIFTFLEIFGTEVLNPPALLSDQLSTIYDLGANIGISSAYFHNLFPSADIFAFEPERHNYMAASDNLKQCCNVRVIPMAVGEFPGSMNFTCDGDTRGGHLTTKDSVPGSAIQQVDVTSISCLIEEQNYPRPDYLKIDVEGAEMEVLKGCGCHIYHIKIINVETHSADLHKNCAEYLIQKGFQIHSDHLSTRGMGWIWALNNLDFTAHD